MSPWFPRAGVLALLPLLLLSLVGCSTASRVVRLETGQGEHLVHSPRGGLDPVKLRRGEFQETLAELAREVRPSERPQQAARELFGLPERSGWYRYAGSGRRLLSAEKERHLPLELPAADAALLLRYQQWCANTWGAGDCLRLLVDGPVLDGDDRYVLAMAIAQGAVLREMKHALGEMVDPLAVVASIASAGTMYMLLWAMPEPVSKGVAATLTIGLCAYLGVDTVWRLLGGWLELMVEVDRTTTFEQLRAAGEKYAQVMGDTAARAFVTLATVALGNTATGLAAKLPTLPGAGQAAVLAEAQLGVRYAAVAEVEAVALTAEGITVTMASTAVAMSARGLGSGSSGSSGWQPPSGGPGSWVEVNESMPERSRRYQAQVTGVPPGYAYRVKWGGEQADFDGFKNGILEEAKGPGYATFIDDKMAMMGFFKGGGKMLEQAERQLRVARGTPIRWIVAEEELAAALRTLFSKRGFDIEVVHISPTLK